MSGNKRVNQAYARETRVRYVRGNKRVNYATESKRIKYPGENERI